MSRPRGIDGFLRFLSEEDVLRLRARGRETRHDPEDRILGEGEQCRSLFLVEEGVVRVEREHLGFRYEVARLGEGQLFGEMSFVEAHPTSASVVAETPVTLVRFDAEDIEPLLEQDPALGERFYKSLAAILSQRLRETTLRSISAYAWGGTDPTLRGIVRERYEPSGEDPWGGPDWAAASPAPTPSEGDREGRLESGLPDDSVPGNALC